MANEDNIFYKLNEFIVFSKYLSITRAAEELHVSTSTLSRHLSDLETMTGAVLVKRGAHLSLTPAGTIFFDSATEIVRTFDDAMTQIGMLNDTGTTDISLACLQEDRVVFDWLSRARCELDREYPGVTLRFPQIKRRSLLETLKHDDIDIAIVFSIDGVDSRRYTSVPCLKDSFYAAVHKDKALDEAVDITVDELMNYTLYYPSNQTYNDFHSLVLKNVYMENSKKPKIRYVDADNMDEFYMVDAPDRVWYFAKSHAVDHYDYLPLAVKENSVLLRVDCPQCSFNRYAVYKNANPNPAVPFFAGCLAIEGE